MQKTIRSKPICGKPIHAFFTGPDKYLRLQKHCIQDVTPPVSESESLFILVHKGMGHIQINGVAFPVKSGTFIWLQSYHTFSIKAFTDSPLEISVCVYDYPLASFLVFEDPKHSAIDSIVDAPPVLQLEEKEFIQIQRLFEEFEMENDHFDPGSALIKVSILGQISDFFMKHSIDQIHMDKNEKSLGWHAILYMSIHFAQNITAESVANEFNTTATTLNRELRNISGYNFVQMLSRIRVNISAIALLYEGMPLSYISTYSGFNSEADFYRTFKKQMGATPMEYRHQILNNGPGVFRGMIMENTLMRILNHSYSNFYTDINIENAAKDLYISSSTIRDLLQDAFGTSFKDLITLTRLRHAEALLLITDMPVLDIALNVGFNSPRSLTRAFDKAHGITPSEYRTMYQGGN